MSDNAASIPTLEAVANAAGVSRATVSRVINGSPNVSERVVKAVQAEIDRMNYVPNLAARSLASRRTYAIALVVPETADRLFTDPFFSAVVQGVAKQLSETDYTLNLVVSADPRPEKTRRYLLGGNVDGALIVSHHRDDGLFAEPPASLPIVFGGRPVGDDASGWFVDVDNAQGARDATDHLISRGRRRIAIIAGPQDMAAGVDRLRGWRQSLEAADLPADLIEFGDFSPASGAAAMRRLLERSDPIDAVFATSDQMAAGAYPVIRDAGLRIPDDIAVVGFDNDVYGLSTEPPLTTVDQPAVELGQAMSRVLLGRIAGEAMDRVTVLPTQLIVRASS